MGDTQTTTDHDTIRQWAEARGGEPAFVADTQEKGEAGGVLRIKFQDEEGDLATTDWNSFFNTFEKNELAALLQEETADGSTSRFVKFIDRHEGGDHH
ncbi:hypothetical protein [Parvularcula maris]|uniref:1,4-alpha-glucan branching enzyme n=1 Tax=Parvularcula maris TaxID=2965077 RepID=A0A9X2RL53_9PROT|nr:hypothetical protein [Parvularcula maris]MCQ8186257.1 hypothetical protein [Parvularcula maris]